MTDPKDPVEAAANAQFEKSLAWWLENIAGDAASDPTVEEAAHWGRSYGRLENRATPPTPDASAEALADAFKAQMGTEFGEYAGDCASLLDKGMTMGVRHAFEQALTAHAEAMAKIGRAE